MQSPFQDLSRFLFDGRSYWQTSSGKQCLPIANQAQYTIGRHGNDQIVVDMADVSNHRMLHEDGYGYLEMLAVRY